MAYITIANANRIIKKIDLLSEEFSGEIYKRPIFFFSKYEKNELLAVQELLSDPEKFFKERYNPLKIQTDTYTYVYEGQKPAYHKSSECPLLKSDFRNFQIPERIKEKGKGEISKFREWFKHNQYLLEKSEDIFAMRLKLKFGIETNQKAITYDNSGHSEIENYNLEQIENKIDLLIKNAGRYYYASNKNTKILKKFSKLTFLAFKEGSIYGNNTGFEDKIVKEFLKDYEKRFKAPLKNLLREYYRLKLNPEIELKGHLLEQLNFKPCRKCHNSNTQENKNNIMEFGHTMSY